MAGTERLKAWWVETQEVTPSRRFKVEPGVTYYIGRDPKDVVEFSMKDSSGVVQLLDFDGEEELSRYILKLRMRTDGVIEATTSSDTTNEVNYMLQKEGERWKYPLLSTHFADLGQDVRIEVVTDNHKLEIIGIPDPQTFAEAQTKLLAVYTVR